MDCVFSTLFFGSRPPDFLEVQVIALEGQDPFLLAVDTEILDPAGTLMRLMNRPGRVDTGPRLPQGRRMQTQPPWLEANELPRGRREHLGQAWAGQGRAGFAQTNSGTVRNERGSLTINKSFSASSFGFLFPQPPIPERLSLKWHSAWAQPVPVSSLALPLTSRILVLLGY